MGCERRIAAVSIALSGLAHTLVIQTAPPLSPSASHRAQSFIELTVEQTPQGRPEPLVPPLASEAPTATPAPRTRIAHRFANKVEPLAPARVGVEQASAQAATAPRAANKLNLIPRASSLTAGDWAPAAPRTNDDAEAHTAAERALNRNLYAAANRPAYREQRAPPQLLPAADGGYDYTARAHGGTALLFRAHIAPDGTVRFEDGATLQLAPIPIGGTFELDDLFRRGEKHSAEKRWFLEQTAALRERLAQR